MPPRTAVPALALAPVPGRVLSTPVLPGVGRQDRVQGSRPRSIEGLAKATLLIQPRSSRLGLLGPERKEKLGLPGCGKQSG